jgi:hypothetical protein
MPQVLAANTVPGASYWLDASALGGGGGDALFAILSMPRLAPDTTDSFTPMVLRGATPTFTFTAPKDLTIKNAVIFDVVQGIEGLGIDTNGNVANYLVITSISVAGTGPNAGSEFVSGGYFPMGGFSVHSTVFAPTFDIALAAGDVLSITLQSVQTDFTLPLALILTYEDGLAGDDPTYFIGIAADLPTLFNVAPGNSATSVITVTGTPTAPGNSITILGEYGSFGIGVEGGTVESIGGTLIGANGGGAPGANSWDTTLVGVTNIRDGILAALSDADNNWTPGYTFAALNADAITMTRDAEGTIGNADRLLVSGANLTITQPTGGTSPERSQALAAAPAALVIDHIVTGPFGSGGVNFYPAIGFYAFPSLVTGVDVNGVPVDVGAYQLEQGISYPTQVPVQFDVPAAGVVTLRARTPMGAALLVGVTGKLA